jgi:protein-tyrosine kinase
MSRIDQALTKTNQPIGSTATVDTGDDPWAIGAQAPETRPSRPETTRTPAAPAARVPGEEPAAHPDASLTSPSAREATAREVPALVARGLSDKVVGGDLPPQVTEEYRRLGALLHHMQVERGTCVVMVTSAVAGEGKTLTATNLALTLSHSYARQVLLVDADLRRPSLHQVFNVVSNAGLGDLLHGADTVPPLVQVTPRLTLLTAGRPDADPLGGLTSDRMRQLIDEARQTFDFVIIDTPPVGLIADANLLAAMVDTALLVVRATSTPYELVRRAVVAIGRHRIAGVVLNRTAPRNVHAQGYAEYYGAYDRPRQG